MQAWMAHCGLWMEQPLWKELLRQESPKARKEIDAVARAIKDWLCSFMKEIETEEECKVQAQCWALILLPLARPFHLF